MPPKTRKLKVIGVPDDSGRVRYHAVDAKTGAYIERQIAVEVATNEITGEQYAEVTIDCRDITILELNKKR